MIGVGSKAIRSVSGSDIVLDDGETTLCRSVGGAMPGEQA